VVSLHPQSQEQELALTASLQESNIVTAKSKPVIHKLSICKHLFVGVFFLQWHC